ncbi:uncharacterized protein [Physcomitrium patens]|uniref:ZC3H15/TMA46 family C-terminal domain-containing protein n=1 Tax=Physcomitrium patens TaxID=3218 RepID=A9S6K5_PHYPA|nr:zinc finger CCCH domain-containing protein 15 homolog [Physcomitrium patens]PNR42332.1 hypothetical protein PHYPA_017161 [Physcomitrium patens]|eukprot:XP_024393057.1 zinc finger CCCH domain-containing protein 15 homolog [Physcomitrella patens]
MGAPEGAVAMAEGDSATVPQMSYAEFRRWKQQKDAEAEARAAEAARKRGEDIAAGRVRMNGRELYQHEPWVFDDSRFDT